MTAHEPLTLNPNTPWCRQIAATLASLGITDIVTSPGTRSAALVSAFQERADCRLHVLTDERAAGFFALGLARSLGRAVAVCVTSGSAVGNLVPALCEAHANASPLLALTCDRPRSSRDAGQPQTTKQAEFCAPLVARLVDLDDPDPSEQGLEQLRATLLAIAPNLVDHGERGPVQINIPLLGRMTSVDGAHGWGVAPPRVTPRPVAAAPASAAVDEIATKLALRPGLKGLIVVGPDENLPQAAIAELAATTQFPLLLDSPGGLRGANLPGAIAEADFLVSRREGFNLKPELLVRIGPAPVSAGLQQYVGACRAPVLRVDRRSLTADYLNQSFCALPLHDHAALAAIGNRLSPGDLIWRDRWQRMAEACRQALPHAVSSGGWSEIQVAATALARPEFGFVHLANSLAIRIGNMLIPSDASQRLVHANRGVAGIDGTLATFLGEIVGAGGPGLLLIGDLAATHDLSALEACLHSNFRGAIVVINNDGGGLFDLLPVRGTPAYRPYIRHRAGIDFRHVARAFRIGFDRCTTLEQLDRALRRAVRPAARLRIIEAVVPPGAIVGELRDFLHRMTGPAVVGALGRLAPAAAVAEA